MGLKEINICNGVEEPIKCDINQTIHILNVSVHELIDESLCSGLSNFSSPSTIKYNESTKLLKEVDGDNDAVQTSTEKRITNKEIHSIEDTISRNTLPTESKTGVPIISAEQTKSLPRSTSQLLNSTSITTSTSHSSISTQIRSETSTNSLQPLLNNSIEPVTTVSNTIECAENEFGLKLGLW